MSGHRSGGEWIRNHIMCCLHKHLTTPFIQLAWYVISIVEHLDSDRRHNTHIIPYIFIMSGMDSIGAICPFQSITPSLIREEESEIILTN